MTEERSSVRTSSRPRPAGRPSSRPGQRSRGRILGLDGLRAVAILAVLIFHLRPATLPGGYLGVDIFFVVSGFLITTLLVRELADRGRLDLRGFWTRRARRLLPALAVVVVVGTVAGLAAGNDLLVDVRRQVLGAATFSTNWLEIAAGSSYFTHTAPQLFVNFWSLAVEEQFYLLWPVLLAVLLAVTRTTRQRVAVVAGLAALSATLMAIHLSDGVTRAYYGTDTHAFGLMIGAALALGLADDARLSRVAWWPRARVALAAAGGAGLVLLLLTLDGESSFAYRGGILLASLCTAAVIAALATARDERDPIVRAMQIRPMVWIGERSYGIYLWHWPVLLVVVALLPPALPDSAGSWLVRTVAVALTFLLAAMSYRLVETPIRRDGFRATAHRVREALRGAPGLRGPRMLAAVVTLLLLGLGVALVVAPEKSQVEQQMEAAAAAAEAPPSAAAEDTSAATDAESAATDEESGETGTSAGTGPLPSGDQISAFGDSMLYVASPALQADYPGIDIDAKSNRQWPDVVDAIEAALDKGTVRDVVLIAAGTNAGLKDPAPLREALDALGPDRLVVLVNIYHSSSWIGESNENMAAVAADYPNVVVADWYGTITEHLDQLQPDGVHPDMDGMYLFSDVVTQALEGAPPVATADGD